MFDRLGAICALQPMHAAEHRLISLAAALAGGDADLSVAERQLVQLGRPADASEVAQARAAILAGHDWLGTEFCLLRDAGQRRLLGATYTPLPIVEAMLAWARTELPAPARIVDPGAGSGRFLVAAAKSFPAAALVAVELDPVAALMLRANAAVHGFSRRLTVHVADYRGLTLAPADRPTLFIGNPPYVRHHRIEPRWKSWFASTAHRFGLPASKLSGLHVHFFLKTRELARSGDHGAFISAAEWLDVNYGSVLRRMLISGLDATAVHIIDPVAQPFADALTTAAITCFKVGSQRREITMRLVGSTAELGALRGGREIARREAAGAPKWSVFVRRQEPVPAGFIELGDLFRVHRGQVTGGNAVWIDGEAARDLPGRFKPFAVTSAHELFAAGIALRSTEGLRRVVDLPAELDGVSSAERAVVECFLLWARKQGAHRSYVARHRRAWWAVGLRAPAPLLCTYMARRPPTFVRNLANVCHINIAHGLYPRQPLNDARLTAVQRWLQRHVGALEGRTYAGGLLKFEPKELERVRLPRIEDIESRLAEDENARRG